MGMSGSKGSFTRMTGRARAGLIATAAVAAGFLFGGVATAGANQLTINFDEARISALAEVLGPIDADPPVGQSVRVTANLASNGSFTSPASGFNFPDQAIPLPEEVAGLLGSTLTLKIGARGSFSGNFNSSTGAFSSEIPLNLNLRFDPEGGALSCQLPLNAVFATTGELVFKGEEGAQDEVFRASPFTAPSRNGAVYGQWPEVRFADVEDAPDSEAGEGTCATIFGLLPVFIPELEGVDGLAGELWLAGKATVPATAPRYSRVALSPKSGKVKRGRSLTLRVSVTNNGGARGTATVALRSSNKQVKVPKSVKITVAPGKTASKTIKVTASKKAKGKVTVSAKVGSRSASARLTVSR
jgi:hypothetical protein